MLRFWEVLWRHYNKCLNACIHMRRHAYMHTYLGTCTDRITVIAGDLFNCVDTVWMKESREFNWQRTTQIWTSRLAGWLSQVTGHVALAWWEKTPSQQQQVHTCVGRWMLTYAHANVWPTLGTCRQCRVHVSLGRVRMYFYADLCAFCWRLIFM